MEAGEDVEVDPMTIGLLVVVGLVIVVVIAFALINPPGAAYAEQDDLEEELIDTTPGVAAGTVMGAAVGAAAVEAMIEEASHHHRHIEYDIVETANATDVVEEVPDYSDEVTPAQIEGLNRVVPDSDFADYTEQPDRVESVPDNTSYTSSPSVSTAC